MARNSVGWFEIYVDDIERARKFYETVMNVQLEKLPMDELEMWRFPGDPDNAGSSGALIHMDGFKAGGNSTIVYFSCEDCATEESRAAKSGGRVFKEKFSIGQYGFISLVFDTEGNMIGLHSLK